MVNWLLRATMNKGAGLGLAVAAVLLCTLPMARAQASAAFGAVTAPSNRPKESKERPLSDRFPDKPSLPPVFSVPIEPLGFTAPASGYLGLRWCFASLGFLDENRLLFTFRVPGLMHRDAEDSASGEERQIRAVVVTLPEGKVEAEALWTVHDRVRYLWMLKDGHFLLRDRDRLQQGDAKLELKPALQFPGPLLWLELDPTQQFMVTNSREPAVEKTGNVADSQKTTQPSLNPGDLGKTDPGHDNPGHNNPGKTDSGKTDLVVRILHRESGKVLLVSRVPRTVHLPINSDGYLESMRGRGQQWVLNLNYFGGGSRVVGRVDSACSPAFEFVSDRELLVTACAPGGGSNLVAMDTTGLHLWEVQTSGAAIWPLLVTAPDGSRLARETMALNRSVDDYMRVLDADAVKGQLVRVFNAADGKLALEAPASPVLDSGGNVAISPTGRRVAILNGGAIQVFDLPAAPPLPAAGNQAAH
jgi:hypothetical protein